MKSAEHSRRKFVFSSAVSLAAVPVLVSGCGDAGQLSQLKAVDNPIEGDDPIEVPGIAGDISRNHGHVAEVPETSFRFVFSIQGESGHPHEIELSLEDMIAIRDGRPLQLTSTEVAGHTHGVTFNPPPAREAEISANHGHALTLTASQQLGGSELNLSLRGSSGHDHEVTLSLEVLQQISRGERVELTSTAGGFHTHQVIFN